MKYLAKATFVAALMAFGSMGFNSTPYSLGFVTHSHANEATRAWNHVTTGGRPTVGTGCVDPNTGNIIEGTDWQNCDEYHSQNEIDDLNEFADSEGGSGGDFGESGGGDFGDADRAAASTAVE